MERAMVEQKVTDTLEVGGKLIIVENVPGRVCLEAGGWFFSLETVERLQQIIWEQKEPKRVIEVPVFEFASQASERTVYDNAAKLASFAPDFSPEPATCFARGLA